MKFEVQVVIKECVDFGGVVDKFNVYFGVGELVLGELKILISVFAISKGRSQIEQQRFTTLYLKCLQNLKPDCSNTNMLQPKFWVT